ncbi:MAG: hypothetical protein JW787_08065 [Sedimentisphaerales bacterium]|nr:hypothetical protein [Sedimentisphaerales bacterium]
MKIKWVFCTILIFLSVLKIQTNLQAAAASQINNILNKTVLTEQDKQIIDDYIRETINALLNENNLSKIARHREVILSRKGSQVQYVQQFNESTEKYITEAFNTIKTLKPAEKQSIIAANLLILIDKLENIQFAIPAMNLLEDKNIVVRYWAVQCLTNPNIIARLNSGQASNPNLPQEITAKFKSIVPGSSPEILNSIARYAAGINITQGEELLLQIADQRIRSYADWSIKLEYIDTNLLKLIESKISNPSDKTDVSALARRFAQLYSYAIQRYAAGFDTLNSIQKAQLATLIVEIEDKCIKNMTGSQQTLRKALETEQLQALMAEHNILLGSDTAQGKLPLKYKFNYGRTDTGSARTAPQLLPRQNQQ